MNTSHSVSLDAIVQFCDTTANTHAVADFPGAHNGLQIQNNGTVSAIGAAVDASLPAFEAAVSLGIDFLIVHHGLFWNPIPSFTGLHYAKLKFAFDHNLAVYSCHLPLDAHPEIGNNRLLADALGLRPLKGFLNHEGTDVALLAEAPASRAVLAERLQARFPNSFTAIEYGSPQPQTIAILTGSGRSAIPLLRAVGTDTLVTGELRQEHFSIAQEQHLNLYPCGHYATETFGVTELAARCARHFAIQSQFVPQPCPL